MDPIDERDEVSTHLEPEPPASAPTPSDLAPEKIVERPSPLTGLARGGIALLAAGWFIGREFLEGEGVVDGLGLPLIGIVLVVFAVLATLSGLLTSRTTTFVADDTEFRIERRLFSVSSSRIDYTKVQSVDIAQPLIARLLGLAKVHIDVGGAGGADLIYLKLSRAESLRDHLLARMHQAHLTADPATPTTGLADRDPGTAAGAEPESVIVRVPARNLLLGAFVSSSTAVAVIIAIVFLIVSVVTREPIAAIPAVLAVGTWVWSQTGRNWGFVMTRRSDSLHISRGALNRSAQGLRPSRIQGVAIRQDLFHRLLGLYSINVTVLGYDAVENNNEGSNALILPYGTQSDVAAVLDAIWPHLNLGRIVPHGQPDRARWLTPLTFATHTWGVDDTVTVAQHGLLTQVRTIVPHRRMQSASIQQGPLQRRLGLATVNIHTTDGPIDLKLYHLDAAEARAVLLEQVRLARLARATIES